MIYVTALITRTHRELLELQTRRQAHLPLADVEEVVAGRLARAIWKCQRVKSVANSDRSSWRGG